MAATPNSSGARRRIRDNPLFTSSPMDLLGDNMRRSLELEFNDCSDDEGKENISLLANLDSEKKEKKIGKRFEFGQISQLDEQGTGRTQSSSISTSSETSSGSSQSSAGEEFVAYDPRQNLRTTRPDFLRYRPDWRLELLSSFEFDQARNAESDLNREAQQDQEVSSSLIEELTVLEAEEEKETAPGAEKEMVLEAEEQTKVAPEAEQETKTTFEAQNETKTALESEKETQAVQTSLEAEQAVDTVHNEAGVTEEASDEEFEEQPDSKAFVTLLGIFLVAALFSVAAITPCFIDDAVWGCSSTSSYPIVDPSLVFQAATSYPSTEHQPDVFRWDWFGEYDIAAYGSVVQEDMSLPITDSDELNALLRTIMTGTEAEIQEKYLEVMEFDEEPESVLFELLNDIGPVQALEDYDEGSMVIQEYDEDSLVIQDDKEGVAASAADAEEKERDLDSSAASQEEMKEKQDDYAPAAEEIDTTEPTRLPSTYEVSIFMSVILAARTLLTFCKKKKGSSTADRPDPQDLKVVTSTPTSAITAVSTTPTKGTTLKAKFAEDVMFEPSSLQHTPYGSIIGYKRVVVNEGSGNERVTLTPVRRSSRIRKHLTQSPPVARRRL